MKKFRKIYCILLTIVLIVVSNIPINAEIKKEKITYTSIKIKANTPEKFDKVIEVNFSFADNTNKTYTLNKDNDYSFIGKIEADKNVKVNFIKIINDEENKYICNYDNSVFETKLDFENEYEFEVKKDENYTESLNMEEPIKNKNKKDFSTVGFKKYSFKKNIPDLIILMILLTIYSILKKRENS